MEWGNDEAHLLKNLQKDEIIYRVGGFYITMKEKKE